MALKRLSIIFAVVFLFNITLVNAFESNEYSEDFESIIALGQSGVSAGFTSQVGTSNYILQTQLDGNKYLEISGKGITYALPNIDGIISNEFDFMLPPSGDIYIHFYNSSSPSVQAITFRITNSAVALYYGASPAVPVASGLSQNTFYNLKIVFDMISNPKSVDVLLDGVLKVTKATLRTPSSSNLRSISFDVDLGEKISLDNIRIKTLENNILNLDDISAQVTNEKILVSLPYRNNSTQQNILPFISVISKNSLPVQLNYELCVLPLLNSGEYAKEITVKEGINISECDVKIMLLDSLTNMSLMKYYMVSP